MPRPQHAIQDNVEALLSYKGLAIVVHGPVVAHAAPNLWGIFFRFQATKHNTQPKLVSWWLNQPIWKKYVRQIGSFPQLGQLGVKMKKNWAATTWPSKQYQTIVIKRMNAWLIGEWDPILWSSTLIGWELTNLWSQTAHVFLCAAHLQIACPIVSKYGIFSYIYHTNQPNVGIYTIHGSYGCWIYFVYLGHQNQFKTPPPWFTNLLIF